MKITIKLITFLLCIVISLGAGYFVHKKVSEDEIKTLTQNAENYVAKVDSLQNLVLDKSKKSEDLINEISERNQKVSDLLNEMGRNNVSAMQKLQSVKNFLIFMRDNYINRTNNGN